MPLECLFVGKCAEELERAEYQVVSITGIVSGLAKTDVSEAPIGDSTNTEVADHVSRAQTVVVLA